MSESEFGRRSARRSASWVGFLIAMATVWLASPAFGQVSNPNVIEFRPQADHWSLRADGTPVVSRYSLVVYASGGNDALMQVDLGKPAPQADGMIRIDFDSLVGVWPLPNANCDARVAALGPDGSVLSAPSNSFVYSCSISLATTSASVGAAGGSGTIQVSTGNHCGWSASSGVSWITIASGASGTGAGAIGYKFAANSGPTRSGTITVGNKVFTVTQAGSSSTNIAPSVSLTSPVSGAAYSSGSPVSVSASASDQDGSVARVDFFANGTLIKTVSNSPFGFTWTTASPGGYVLVATAYDNAGASTSSTAVPISIVNSSGATPAYLSDLPWTSATNGWGPAERDRSNGEVASGDGRTITLGTTTYAKGLGVHAGSELRYALRGACSLFSAFIGIDAEVGHSGSVAFQVWADGAKLFDSGIMYGTTAAKSLAIDISTRSELTLIVSDAGDGTSYDHGDWAGAQITCTGTGAGNEAVTRLSDLTWTSMVNGWGPAERDRSNGDKALGDGGPITLNGRTYAKGIGVNATADIRYSLNGVCSAFAADVGVDDEVADRGSVIFQVWADGTKLYDSGLLTGLTATQTVNVSLAGRKELALIVTDGGNGTGKDHADWADARVTCTTATRFVSDLTPTATTNGWGPAERDQSNGENASGDGNPITVNGRTYGKGLGVHAGSTVQYALDRVCSAFKADIGIDQEVGTNGSVVFQVWTDGVKLYESGLMRGSTQPQSLSIDVSGRQQLSLVVTDGSDGVTSDHADWADARVTCTR